LSTLLADYYSIQSSTFFLQDEFGSSRTGAEGGQCIKDLAQDPKMHCLSGTLAKTQFYALWKMPEHSSLMMKKGMINPPPKGVGKYDAARIGRYLLGAMEKYQ